MKRGFSSIVLSHKNGLLNILIKNWLNEFLNSFMYVIKKRLRNIILTVLFEIQTDLNNLQIYLSSSQFRESTSRTK